MVYIQFYDQSKDSSFFFFKTKIFDNIKILTLNICRDQNEQVDNLRSMA